MSAQTKQDFESEFTYHRREWVGQRIGWTCMFVFILAACLGLFGGGALATQVAEYPGGGLKITYERFARYASNTSLEFTIGEALGNARVVVEGDENFFRNFEIKAISPEPQSSAMVGGRLHLTFDIERPPATITMHLKPTRIGAHSGVFQLQRGPEVQIEQFIYP